MSSVVRYDQHRAGKAERTREGFLRVPATIARAGVLTYNFSDGTQRREFVPPEELSRADSVKSLSMLPVTNGHPPEGLVTSDNARRVQVGQLGESAAAEGGLLSAKLLITDGGTIADIANGKAQVSAGYTCDLEFAPGSWNGEHYDAVQRNRQYNHVAIVDVGRAGPQVALHLDSKDATRGVSFTEEKERMEKLTVDGVEIELEATKAAIVKHALSKRDGELFAAQKRAQEATAKADAAKVEVDAAVRAHQDAKDPKRMAEAVKARVALQNVAAKHLGAEVKLDDLTDRDIMVAVGTKFAPSKTEELKKADEAYVRAFYEAALEGLGRKADDKAEGEVDDVRRDNGEPPKSEPNSYAAREAFIKKQRERANKIEPTKV